MLSSGYLCVDFFFLLSGFVIANSYEERLQAGLGFARFFAIRMARIWPLVAFSTLLALIFQFPRWHRELGTIDGPGLAITVLFNGFSLPSPTSPNQILFPLNGAAWSIFFELAVNFLYAWLVPLLSRGVLIGLIVMSGIALALTGLMHNTLDIGWGTTNFVFGFPRVAFSFFLGVLLYRALRGGPRAPGTFSPWVLGLSLLVVLATLSAPASLLAGAKGLYDFAIVAVALPALLVVAVGTRYRSWGNTVAWLLGGTSYSVYLLQTPLVIGFSGIPQVLFGTKIAAYTPWAGILFIALFLPLTYVVWRYFERPAQSWLLAKTIGRQSDQTYVLGVPKQ